MIPHCSPCLVSANRFEWLSEDALLKLVFLSIILGLFPEGGKSDNTKKKYSDLMKISLLYFPVFSTWLLNWNKNVCYTNLLLLPFFMMFLISECYISDGQTSTNWFLIWLLGNDKYYDCKSVVLILVFKLLVVVMRIWDIGIPNRLVFRFQFKMCNWVIDLCCNFSLKEK